MGGARHGVWLWGQAGRFHHARKKGLHPSGGQTDRQRVRLVVRACADQARCRHRASCPQSAAVATTGAYPVADARGHGVSHPLGGGGAPRCCGKARCRSCLRSVKDVLFLSDPGPPASVAISLAKPHAPPCAYTIAKVRFPHFATVPGSERERRGAKHGDHSRAVWRGQAVACLS